MRKLTRYVLSSFGGRAVTKDDLEKVCRRFGVAVDSTVNFMLSYGYLVRIIRGLYYVKTIEEFELKKSRGVNDVLSLGLNKLGVEWYFGLYTALRLNGLTHEFFDTVFVLNNRIYRPVEITVGGEKVKFIKLVGRLLGFGVVYRNGLRFSDVEKTLLDLVYISRYRSISEERTVSMLEEYGKVVDADKIRAYLKFYPKTVESAVENARLV